ncbi:MAG: hydrogenase expression/formation protein HypE [Thermoplasmata archaeon]
MAADRITMAHGAGGAVMGSLIKDRILKHLGSTTEDKRVELALEELDDSAVIDGIVLSTDSYVVKPIFFPGGDIGSLAVAGTINDLSAVGAEPLALSCGLIIEEGFLMEDFDRIVESIDRTGRDAGVPVVTGDLKVMEKGAIDEVVVNTSGIGKRSPHLDANIEEVKRYREFDAKWIKDSNIRPGDAIIVSGFLGDHGITVISFREGYGFESKIESDASPLNKMIGGALKEGGIVAMKDPTRGGFSNTLNEWSEKADVGIVVREADIPVREGVRSACEMLGIDPLDIGNEGKVVVAVVKEKAEAVLEVLKSFEEGKDAAIVGEATSQVQGVVLETIVGGKRILDMPVGDPIPRIC